MLNKSIFILFFLIFFINSSGQETYSTKLIYSKDFDSITVLDDWLMEGPGIAQIADGKLLLHSKYATKTQNYLNKQDSVTGYYDFVEGLMKKDPREEANAYKIDGRFRGGHIVLWNKHKTPENYILECDFQSLSNYSLHMILFSHLGVNGESVFSHKLKPRNGLAAQYTRSDMVGYRVSYFAPERGTTNLRKSPEKKLLIKGDDFTLIDKEAIHKLRLIKNGKSIIWQINGETAFEYVENNPEKELGGGYFAIRLMVPAMGLYDNFKLYEIL